MAALVGKISNEANSMAAHARYIPGKRFELPDSALPGTTVRSATTTRIEFNLTSRYLLRPYIVFLISKKCTLGVRRSEAVFRF